MTVTLLKITSIILLGVTLFFLVQKRDFSIKPATINSSQPPSLEEKPLGENSQDTHTQVEEVVQAADNITNEIVKANPYIDQNEGVSDTDESYRPEISPCVKPVGYKLGTFDTRFGISKENFIHTITQAASLWEGATHKKLFYYDEGGELTINLIYDERQSNTVNINNLSLEIENSKNAAEALKTSYEQEKDLFTEKSAALIKVGEDFQVRSKTYSDKVAMYNSQGGAPKGEYDTMMQELAKLQNEVEIINEKRTELQTITNSINAKVARYNEFVTYINELIKKSNTIGAKKFTEGKFAPSTNTIDIYQYDNTTKLFRVISHELGHALGINHTTNRSSIMYSVNIATSTVLTPEDIAALREVCR